jgi:prolyl 4-hydroxylase
MLLFEYPFPNQSSNHIGAWIIPHNICDDIVKNFEDKKEKHQVDESGVRNYTFMLNFHLNPELEKLYLKYIVECIERYKKKYSHVTNTKVGWGISSPYNIQKYEPGEYYSQWHFEGDGPVKDTYQRHLVWMTYLHDVPDSGGTEFLYQNIKTVPRKGMTLIWPAGWTHVHRGIPCDVTKYIITGWITFNQKS